MKISFKNILILLFASCFVNDLLFAQDTLPKKDTSNLYSNIKSYSNRSKFAGSLYRLIFKPVKSGIQKKDGIIKGYNSHIQKPYSTFEGKVIRNIDVITLDPWGYSISDSIVKRQNILYATGNKLHIKTHGVTIRNLLLFHKNHRFSSLLVRESERLIRSQTYVHDVSFYVASAGENSDSVDILIRELDKWSIVPVGSISPAKVRIGLTDNNFIGSGHRFENSYGHNFDTRNNTFYTFYYIPNIRNTFINSALHYGIDGYGNNIKSFAVDRPFYSPVAKWAAGVSFASQTKRDSSDIEEPVTIPVNLKFNTQDYWAGKATRIFKGNIENELITNLIFTARYFHRRYSERPSDLDDPLHVYSDERFYLAGIGITSRNYVQDSYIFKFGITEDVPVGKVLEFTGGYQVRNNAGRPYFGMRFSYGNYNRWGYLSPQIGYGTFFHSSHTEQGVFTAGISYFTGLFQIGNWKFRQFAKPQVTVHINSYEYDSLTINDGFGIDGFNSTALSGSRRASVTLQTQSYIPWTLYGFHFGPFFNCSFGMVGDAVSGFKESKVYSQIGVGVLIRNFNLVFQTFQISVSFYPSIPGRGEDIFKFNAFRTNDFGFRDFEIGKPVPVTFR
ncbi:MAG TPA: hypothetical protein DDY34_18730 [Bacteroidales bacterium]|nr:hypothetical protein [Bacteroidales bacterium]HBQ81819.1 hypothetical protein [Bacteroidales bacterium]HCU17880.1 hypothetical protein [Bacteroidales bacterium]